MSIEYKCKKCPKQYSTYKSLWRHDALKHKSDVVKDVVVEDKSVVKNVVNVVKKVVKNNICKKCNKELSDRVSRWKHEKICVKDDNKSEIEEIKAEMERLRDIIQKSLKIHPKTLQKINNQLNNNINTTNNITNNTINNNLYVQLGNEDLVNVLSKSEKRGILNRKSMGINDLVELIHCSGKYKQFMNVYITNLQNTVAYCYNEKLNNFIVVNKNELLNDIIDSRIYDITKFLEEAEKVLEPNTAADIKRIIKKMETDDSFKGLKKEEIKFILYNNKDKIMIEKDKLDELEL